MKNLLAFLFMFPAIITVHAQTGMVQDYDGNTYNTIRIGRQEWMKENLQTTHYADGDSLVDGSGAGDISWDQTTKYWFVYDNNPANKSTWGLLYTWAAVMNDAEASDSIPSGIQGVCPDGWHLPSDAEWKELEMYLGMSQAEADATGWRGTDQGGKLKDTTLWASPNAGATNSSGFTALPAGYRHYSMGFGNLNFYANFWTSTDSWSWSSATARELGYANANIDRGDVESRWNGYSVRCLRPFNCLTCLEITGDTLAFGVVNYNTKDTAILHLRDTCAEAIVLDSIRGLEVPFSLDFPEYPELENITITSVDTPLYVIVTAASIAGIFEDTVRIYSNGFDTSLAVSAEIPFPDNLIATPGDGQVTLTWNSACWNYRDMVYIYRDLSLYDSMEITSTNDTVYLDDDLINYQEHNYYIRSRDINGHLSAPSDTATATPCVTVEDYDGNTYGTVKIGDQVWMRENIKTTHYADGSSLVNGTGVDLTGDYMAKYWFVYNDSMACKPTYGLLYTWAAAMNGTASSDANPSGIQGICPDGWHLPSDSEWKELEIYLGMSQAEADLIEWRGIDEGDKLKEAGTNHWSSPNTGTNSSSFTALPGGERSGNGGYISVGTYANIWSSTMYSSVYAWFRVLGYNYSEVDRTKYWKYYGFSVRCLRDFDYLPYLAVSEDTVDFGEISCNSGETTLSLYLTNNYPDTVIYDSFTGADYPFSISFQDSSQLDTVIFYPGDPKQLNITLSSDNIAGVFIDTINIYDNSYDTSVIIKVEIPFPDSLIATPGDQQVKLSWNSACWEYRDMVYIYRDLTLIDSLEITSATDTVYTDTGLDNYHKYTYYIRSRDIRGNIGSPSDNISEIPCEMVVDYDSNSYPTIKIGDQLWMRKNLKTTHYADGSALVNGQLVGPITPDDTTKYWFVYQDNITYKEIYGLLYTWATAMNGAASSNNNPCGVQGVCPDGWHLPSDEEWKELEMFLGLSQAQADQTGMRGTIEGGKLKETGTTHWKSPNTGATNSSWFTALGGGYRVYNGAWGGLRGYTEFWSSTEYDASNSLHRELADYTGEISRIMNDKNFGFSVRCLKIFDYLSYLSVSEDTVDFGKVSSNTGDTSQSIALINTFSDVMVLDSIRGADLPFSLDLPGYPGLENISIPAGDTVLLNITLSTDGVAGIITDTVLIYINGMDTSVIIHAEIPFPDNLTSLPGNQQVTLAWNSTCWNYRNWVLIYRDLALIDSVEISSSTDTTYTDTALVNDQEYTYFIRSRDIWGQLSDPSDTISEIPCEFLVEDYDGNIYPTVKIGDQVWMRENLKTTHYADGDSLVNGTEAIDISGDYTTKYWFVYNNTPAYKDTYGLLYTWAAAINSAASSDANPSGVQGVCPDGWHLPSDAEWKELEMFLGMNQTEADAELWRGTDEGGKLKETGTTHWVSPNAGATNSSGFTALPGGYRISNGDFEGMGSHASFWSPSEYSSNYSWTRLLFYNNSLVGRMSSFGVKEYGYSVRCLRDFDYLSYLTISDDTVDFGKTICNNGDITLPIYLKNTYTDSIVLDSIAGASLPFTLDIPTYPALEEIIILAGDSALLNVILSTDNIAGIFEDTIRIYCNSYDTSLIVTAEIPFPDNLISTVGNEQVTLKWNSTCWNYRDRVYIYRDLILIDSVEITSAADTSYTDAGLHNDQEYTYFIRSRDTGGHLSISSDTVTATPDVIIEDYDGNTYTTVKIGNQLWMRENLKTTHYSDGAPLVDGAGTGDITGDYTTKYWFVYEDNMSNKATYGLLYSWAATMNGATTSDTNPSSVQGVCPDGWHLPSDAEWKELEMYLGMSQAEADGTGLRGTDEGGKLKETDITHWTSPNTGATNSSGFTAMPGGYRFSGDFYNLDYYAYFWSSADAWYRALSYTDSGVDRNYIGKETGFSVRCLMDFDYRPYLGLSTDTVDFGIISKNLSDTTQSIYLKNTYSETIKIDSIYGAGSSFVLEMPDDPDLKNISITPGDSVRLNITLLTDNLTGTVTDNIGIHINSYETLLILTARVISFPETIQAIPWDQQVTVAWDTTSWEYIDRVYIYRDLVLADSVEITSYGDTAYIDADLINYQDHSYFIRSKDIWGFVSTPTDTLIVASCEMITDYDGNDYRTVKIGDQLWMRENLKTTHYADGTSPDDGSGIGDPGWASYAKWWFVYENNIAYKISCGLLYTWAAAMNGVPSSDTNPSGIQGICPNEWHLPSDSEWKELEMYLGMSQSEANDEGWRGTTIGTKLKTSGTPNWNSPNSGADNSSGFSALPCGMRWFGGYGHIHEGAYFWSSTWSYTAMDYYSYSWSRMLSFDSSAIYRNSDPKPYGLSVRCIRDFDYLPYLDISANTIYFGSISCNTGDTTQSIVLTNSYFNSLALDSIRGADLPFTLDLPDYTGLEDISIPAGNSTSLNITLATNNIAGIFEDTIWIFDNGYNASLTVKAEIPFPDILTATPGNQQVTLTWSSSCWNYRNRVYIYRDLILIDSVEITSAADTSYTDTGLTNDQQYEYFIRSRDINGNISSSSDTLPATPELKVEDFDGNVYHTVKIGNQVWLRENLQTTHYADGTSLVDGTGEGDISFDHTTKYWFVYGDNPANKSIYGLLYTWAAAMNGADSSSANPSGIQGVCPAGWHLPSDAEWKELEMYLGMSQAEADAEDWRGTDEGGKLKETGTAHWESPNNGATNSSGFTALPGGFRNWSGTFYYINSYAHFWTTSGSWSWAAAIERQLGYYNATINRNILEGKEDGLSVRCLMNPAAQEPPGIPTLNYPEDGAINVSLDVELSWNASQDAISYHLQVATDASFNDLVLDDSELYQTSSQPGVFVKNQAYYWRVRAGNSSGYSDWSVARSFTTQGLITPSLLEAYAGNGQVTLFWSRSSDPDFLRYRIYGTSQGATTAIDSTGSINDTSITFTGLNNNQTYYYRITVVLTSLEESDFSNEMSATPSSPGMVTVPSNLSITSCNLEVTVNWDPNPESNISRYRIFRSLTSPAYTLYDSVMITADPDTQYIDINVNPDETYYYRITAVDDTGDESDYSAEVSVTVQRPVSLGGDREACYPGPIVLDAGAGFTSYQWSVADSSGRTLTIYSTGEYRVKATDATGCTTSDTVLVTIHDLPVANLGDDVTGCEGLPVVLDAGIDATGYEWSVPDSSDRTMTVTADGTYWVRLTNEYGCQGADTISVAFRPAPIPDLGADRQICPYENTILDAGTGYTTYEWSDPDSSGQTLTVSVAGTYVVTVTDNYGCKGNDAVEVSYYDLPPVDITGDADICTGETTVLDAGAGYASYLWSADPPNTGQTITTGTEGWYRVDVTDNHGCTSSDSVEVIIHEPPVVNLGADVLFCPGSMAVLDAGDFASYEWSVPDSVSRTLYITDTGEYWVKVTDIYGCTDYDTISMQHFPVPVVNLGNDIMICQGSAFILNAGPGFNSYSWSVPDSTGQTVLISVAGIYWVDVTDYNGCNAHDTIEVSYHPQTIPSLGPDISACEGTKVMLDAGADFTSYQWSVPDSAGQTLIVYNTGEYIVTTTDGAGCLAGDTVFVTFHELPVASLGNDITVCDGQSVVLDAGIDVTSYEWSVPDSSGRTMTVTADGNYWVRLTDEYGCQDADTISVTLQPVPTPDLGADRQICPYEETTLDAGAGYTAYEWSVPDSSGQTLTVSFAGTYVVTVTDNYGCKGNDALEVSYYDLPPVQITGDADICPGETTVLDAGTGYASYLWSVTPPDTDQTINTGSAGKYWVRVSDNHGCINSDTLEVVSHLSPVATLGEDKGFCPGGTAVLDAGNFAAYEWSVADSASRTLHITDEGEYWVKVTDNNGCTDYDTITTYLLPVPSVSLGKDTSICENSGITLDAGAGFTSYYWSVPGNTARTLYVTSEGDYYVTVTDANGCTDSDTVAVSLYTSLAVNLGDDIVLCEGNDTTLSAGQGGNSWLWSTGEITRDISVSETGNYWVESTDAAGCTGRDTVHLQIQPAPVVHATTSKNPIYSNDSTMLSASGASSYSWSPDTWLSNTTGSSVYAKPFNNIVYNVAGTDVYGCTGSDSIRINVFCPSKGRYTVIDTVFGIIDFTCYNRVYRPNDTSSWLLYPKGATKIFIDFNYGTFDIHAGDTVRVFEGHDNTGKVLAKYNNNHKPGSHLTANLEMYIEFISNASGTGNGFKAYFWTDVAGGTVEVQEVGELKIYPNPFRESTIIEFPNPDFEPYRLILMDLSGKIHRITGQITGSRYELMRENLENGFYIIELVGPEVYRGRVLIE